MGTSGAYYYVTVGDDAYYTKARASYPLDLGSGNYANGITCTIYIATQNVEVSLYTLTSAATTAGGEWLNAIKVN